MSNHSSDRQDEGETRLCLLGRGYVFLYHSEYFCKEDFSPQNFDMCILDPLVQFQIVATFKNYYVEFGCCTKGTTVPKGS